MEWLTLASFSEILDRQEPGKILCAFLDGQNLHLSSQEVEASLENLMFYVVPSGAPRVDSMALTFRDILATDARMGRLKIWIGQDGTAWPVRLDHIGTDAKVVLLVLEAGDAVRALQNT